MFEHLDDQARRSVVFAQEAARSLGHSSVGSGHLLLGLLYVDGGEAATALTSEGIDPATVRHQVEKTGVNLPPATEGRIPLASEVETALELSQQMALDLGDSRTGTGHILLILIGQREGVAARVLLSLGADLSRVRQQVIKLHASSSNN